MPYTLTYSSTAVFVLSDDEVSILLARSRELNVADDVTGLLVYLRLDEDQAAFVQVLEGDQNAVEQTYARIEGDELHTGLTVLHRGTIQQRRFPEWSMKFARLDQPALQEVFAEPYPVSAGNLLADRAKAEQLITAAENS
ncbi:BLUF domain-containing protein [Amycolatopsis minnesotensis]|uniref:BLUF domain-containing protein n=1 Tax=Amycolatopsis minnesotensis TaxID=337894 RepID=A0ABP5E687_9PSEU